MLPHDLTLALIVAAIAMAASAVRTLGGHLWLGLGGTWLDSASMKYAGSFL